jgi:hypothetical protein
MSQLGADIPLRQSDGLGVQPGVLVRFSFLYCYYRSPKLSNCFTTPVRGAKPVLPLGFKIHQRFAVCGGDLLAMIPNVIGRMSTRDDLVIFTVDGEFILKVWRWHDNMFECFPKLLSSTLRLVFRRARTPSSDVSFC